MHYDKNLKFIPKSQKNEVSTSNKEDKIFRRKYKNREYTYFPYEYMKKIKKTKM